MSTNKTENYKLHTWEPSDHFLRTEFNDNFAAIDAILKGKAEVVFGTYTGNKSSQRTIQLGFTPSLLLLMGERGIGSTYSGGLTALGHPLKNQFKTFLEIVENGFQVAYWEDAAHTNSQNSVYHYLAFR